MITDTWISKTMAMDNVHTHRIQDLKQQLYLLALMMCPDRIMKTNLSAVKKRSVLPALSSFQRHCT